MKKDGKDKIQDRESINIKKIKRKKKNVRVLNLIRGTNKKRRRDRDLIRSKGIKDMREKRKINTKNKGKRIRSKDGLRSNLCRWAKYIKGKCQK